jgi:tRNA/rRNA methyltransferase
MPSGSDPSGEHAGSVLNLTVVCLRPQGSANLGSIARAMMNFGFRDLILVNPRCPIDEQSFRMACHADSILRRARTVSRLAELAPEFHAWIGTSGKTDPSAHGEPLLPEDLAAAVIPAAEGHRLALLLGPEDHGLSNQELKMCRWIVRIPACPDYPSLNIAQAAAILLYVLAVPPAVGPPSPHARMPASVEDTEQFFGQLRTLPSSEQSGADHVRAAPDRPAGRPRRPRNPHPAGHPAPTWLGLPPGRLPRRQR